MTSDGLAVLSFLFQTIWRLFTSWTIPGTHTTPAAWFMFMLSVVLSIRVARIFLNLSSDGKSGGDNS